MRLLFLAAASAVFGCLFANGTALADPPPDASDTTIVPQGVIGGDYSHLWLNHGLGSSNVFGGELSGIVPLGPEFSGQVIGGYHRVEGSGAGANDWNVSGTVSWDTRVGRLGANVGYANTGLRNANADATNYGVYGEYYFGDLATLGLRGGGVTASANALGLGGGRSTGGYVGAEGIGYFTPDVAARGTLGYVGLAGRDRWTAGLRAEYLFSRTTPISGWIGWDYGMLGLGGGREVTSNTFSIGLKYYFGGSGSLEHRQRTGVDDWGPATLDLIR